MAFIEDDEERLLVQECKDSGKFNHRQIEQIAAGFSWGLNLDQVKFYAKPIYNWKQMEQLRCAFINDNGTFENVELLANPDFDDYQMKQIRYGFNKNNLSVEQIKLYAKPEFTWQQMQVLRCAFSVDNLSMEEVKTFADPNIDEREMCKIRSEIANDLSFDLNDF